MLANILRTDRPAHRPIPEDSELARSIRVLARAQQDAVWDRQPGHLARGWDVTAVDITPRALGIAQRGAARAGVTPRFVRGDVARLPELGLGHDYDLRLDFGCLHTLPADRRPAYPDGVTQAAKAAATLLVYGFRQPSCPNPMFAGLTEEEVRHRFGPAGWEFTAAEPALDDLSPTGRQVRVTLRAVALPATPPVVNRDALRGRGAAVWRGRRQR